MRNINLHFPGIKLFNYPVIFLFLPCIINFGICTAYSQTYFSDGFEAGLRNWIVSGQDWDTTSSTFRGGRYCITESPKGNYLANANSIITLASSLNLTTATVPILIFWHKYSTEGSYDNCRVEISTDGGSNWSEVKRYSGSQSSWTQEQIDLSNYKKQNVKIRFRLISDYANQYDGWYIDDIEIKEFNIGSSLVLPFIDYFETGLSNWIVSGQDWDTTSSTFRSSRYCITDSPKGNYLANANSIITLAGSLNLTTASFPILTFWQKYSTEGSYDNCRVEISTDGGSNWSEVKRYSGSQSSWTQEQIDLSNYKKQNIKIRFRLTSDYTNQYDGWYIDDVFLSESNVLKVLTPNGGEILNIGDTTKIDWLSAGINNVKIEYSTDNGANWSFIINTSSKDYSWFVPNTPSVQCKVKISDLSNSSLYDESDSLFTIRSSTTISPIITLNKNNLTFMATQSGSLPSSQTFTISNSGGGTLNWNISKSQSWLSINPVSGSGNGTITVSTNTTNLNQGTYYDTITVTAVGASNNPQKIIVTYAITSLNLPTVTTVSADSITSNSVKLKASVNPNGVTTTAWFEWGTSSNLSSYSSTTSQTIGSGTSSVSISANVTGLNPNTTYYYRVAAQNAAGIQRGSILSFTTIENNPRISLSTTTINFNATQNGSLPSSQTVTISNSGGGTLNWSVSKNQSWLSINPISGTGNGTITVSTNTTNLNPGTYYDTVTVTATGASNSPQKINITYTVSQPVSAPTATTNAATSISSNSATLKGTVNANNGTTTVTFEYGTTTSYGSTINATPNTVTGSTNTTVTANLTGLSSNTTYHYRLKSINSIGTSYGDDQTFTTSVSITAPTVTTNTATSVTSSGATLNGTVNANNGTTTVTFEYGTTTSYGSTVNATPNTITGSTNTNVTATFAGLYPSIIYHYRVKAVNSAGTSYGNDQTFTTSTNLPIVTTKAVSTIASTTATLLGSVNPNGSSTVAWFEYGTNNNLASSTSSKSVGVGTGDVNFSEDVTGFTPLTIYYYRIAAQNSAGKQYGTILNFTTRPDYPTSYNLNTTISFQSYSNLADYKNTDYKLVGLPGKSEKLVKDFLTGTQSTDWQVFWDNGANSNYKIKYDGSDNFKFYTGRGFWILKTNPLTINTTVSTAILNSNYEIEIALHSGWNIITNPFTSPIFWSKIQTTNTISDPIYKYSKAYDYSTTLDPYTAYYFDNRNNLSTLKIPFPTQTLSKSDNICRDTPPFVNQNTVNNQNISFNNGLSNNNVGVSQQNQNIYINNESCFIYDGMSQQNNIDWIVNIILKSNEFTDRTLYFGISENAKSGLDKYDFRKPRIISETPNIYFDRSNWGDEYKYMATDIRPNFDDSQTWEFVCTNDPVGRNAVSSIQFSGINSIPSQFDVYLFDVDKNKYINLRQDSIYNYKTVNNISKFNIIVGKSNYINEKQNIIPNDFVLTNYPNPFNPSTKISVTIPYTSEIKLTIYNILGKEVKSICNGVLSKGQYNFDWGGRDETGNLQTSGIYIYRLITNSGVNISSKMILMK